MSGAQASSTEASGIEVPLTMQRLAGQVIIKIDVSLLEVFAAAGSGKCLLVIRSAELQPPKAACSVAYMDRLKCRAEERQGCCISRGDHEATDCSLGPETLANLSHENFQGFKLLKAAWVDSHSKGNMALAPLIARCWPLLGKLEPWLAR